VDGACRLTTAHPDTLGDLPPDIDLSPFASLIRSLGLPFVTADLARRTDGTWRLIELGDGQVSDRPATTDAGAFLSAILPQG
jgi:ATP-grasp domain, R2K clade family 3